MKTERVLAAWVARLGLLMVTGCDEPLSRLELIDKTRVLAAKVEVAGDPTRAAPLPGEDLVVRWLVVAPEPDAAFAYVFRACVASASPADLASCQGDPLATSASPEPVAGDPTIAFQAPPEATGNERLAVLGGVCPAGASLASESGPACSDGSSARAVSLDFAMDDGGHPNTNPVFTSVTLDGSELAAESSDATDCTLLTSVPRGGKHRLAVELAETSRDPLPQLDAGDPARESLLLSYFVTSGELDHAWGAIDSAAPSTSGSVTFTAPVPRDQPLLERFFVVVRDGRGGSDFVERRVCVTP
jgi:hypothetical protein